MISTRLRCVLNDRHSSNQSSLSVKVRDEPVSIDDDEHFTPLRPSRTSKRRRSETFSRHVTERKAQMPDLICGNGCVRTRYFPGIRNFYSRHHEYFL